MIVNADFFAKYTYDDINASTPSSKFANEMSRHTKTKIKASKEINRCISVLIFLRYLRKKFIERCIYNQITTTFEKTFSKS